MRSRARSPASDHSEDSQRDEQLLSGIGRRTLSSRRIIDQWRYIIATGVSSNPYAARKEAMESQHKPQERPRKAIPETKRSSSTFGFHSPTWGSPTVNCHIERRTRQLLETEVPHTGYVQSGSFATGRHHPSSFETWASASNVWATVRRVLRSSSVVTRQTRCY